MKDTETADRKKTYRKNMEDEKADWEAAEKFADLVYRPSGAVRPGKEQVFRFLAEGMGADPKELLRWEREPFVCRNGPVELHGEFYPLKKAPACAVLAHGFGQNRYILLPQQKIFRELGFSTVIFDQRGFGESTKTDCTFGIKEAQDVACVVNWAKEHCQKGTRIVLLGVSMGAAASMMAMEYTDKIDYLVEDCGFADVGQVIDSLYRSLNKGAGNPRAAAAFRQKAAVLGLDIRRNRPIDAVKKSSLPICIIHGASDSTIAAGQARALYEACQNPASRLELFEEKEHALCVTDRARYKAVLREFLEAVF